MPVMLDNRAYFSVSLSVGRRFTALVVEGWGSAMALLLLWVKRLHFPARGPRKVQVFEDSEQIKDAGERVELSARDLQNALQPAVRLAEDLHDQAHRAPSLASSTGTHPCGVKGTSRPRANLPVNLTVLPCRHLHRGWLD